MPVVVLAVFCLAAVVTAALLRTGLAARLALDVPNSRSLHAAPIPRVGGVVLVAALLAGWAALPVALAALAIPAALLCAFSFIDDRHGLPVLARLAIHFAAAAAFLALTQPTPEHWPLLALLAAGLVWLTNLYNFMDGMDGLAGGMALIGFGVLGIGALPAAAGLAAACFCVAAAAAAFLLFNWHPARLFLGDAGSIPLGFLAGALGIRGWLDGAWPPWFPLLAFSPFVVDASVTLLRRALRGEKVWQAHREHFYQRLVRMGWSHRRTALAEYALMLAMGLLALSLREAVPAWQLVGLVGAAVAYLGLMALVDARWRGFVAGQADA